LLIKMIGYDHYCVMFRHLTNEPMILPS